MLPSLFEHALNIEYEEDFQLHHDELIALKNLSDLEIVKTMIWLKENGATSQELIKPKSPSLAWCEFKLGSNNLRTRFYCFLVFLSHTNPILNDTVDKLLKKI